MKANHLAVTSFRLLVLLLCAGLSTKLAITIRNEAGGAETALDFGGVYYQARCAIEHKDPYDPDTVLKEFEGNGWKLPVGNTRAENVARSVVTEAVYLPTALLVMAPLARLPWSVARDVWLGLVSALLALALLAAWDLATDAPVLAGCMAAFMLLNCVLVMVLGNPAGVVIPLCVITAWCFLKDRFTWMAVAILAIGLAVKPQDAGFVWLYFLLAGGVGRKRALQTLAAVGVLAACAAIWMLGSSPHWMGELHRNLTLVSVHGGTSDPGPAGITNRGIGPIVSLQNSVGVFRDDPHFYNAVTYAVVGGLILWWGIAVLRKRSTREEALLALAAVSLLTMLPVYHRSHDAKLLMLAIPACAMLWKAGGVKRWIALALTGAAILVTSDIPNLLLAAATRKVTVSPSTMSGKFTLLMLQPAPLVLLVTGCFYLWLFIRYEPPSASSARESAAEKWLDAAVAE